MKRKGKEKSWEEEEHKGVIGRENARVLLTERMVNVNWRWNGGTIYRVYEMLILEGRYLTQAKDTY